jgi:hypothetical protein
MARWYLIAPHYLRLAEPLKWEYTETSRKTGKPIRKQFDVECYLNPDDESAWTEKARGNDDSGRIYVSDGKDYVEGDIVFVGSPTPDMIPDDDGAKKISAECQVKLWKNFNPADAMRTFSQSMIDDNLRAQAEVVTEKPNTDIAELTKVLGQLVQQNAELIRATTTGIRR